MLLKSSLFLLFIGNVYLSHPLDMGVIFFIVLLINLFKNKDLKKGLKKMRFLFLFYMGTCFFQLLYLQEGEVLYRIGSFYITKTGANTVFVNFIRIINLIMISWLVNSGNLLRGPLKRYQLVGECVMEMVPEVFSLFKKRMKPKWFFRHILKQIKVKI